MQTDDAIERVLGGVDVEAIETHGSRVFLHAHDVYKVKKPVRFPFLDYTTLELRKRACEEELRVNRRAAPHVYLGVRPIVRLPDGDLQLAEDAPPEESEVLEWVVHMRRLPDAQRADNLLEADALRARELRLVAEFLAQFHESAERDQDPQGDGSVENLRRNANENLDSLEPHARQILGTETAGWLRRQHLAQLEHVVPLLEERLKQGRVVDGHGDFRLEHVYLSEDDEVTLLDAIEFDRGFRVADVCADAAFLAMDLCSRARTDLAEEFIAFYARESGDHDLYALIDFYMSYWALVRAKVDAVRSQQQEADEADVTLERCARRLFLATHLSDQTARTPAVFAVAGLIASGKSRVATTLGEKVAAPVLSSDRVRKQLADRAPSESLGDAPYEGAYSEENTRRVYDELLRRTKIVVKSGRPVVIDASFQEETARSGVRELAQELGVPCLFIECQAPKEEIQARLERRTGRVHDSDARAPLLERFQSQYPPWRGEDARHQVAVDTTRPPEEVDAQVMEHVRDLRRTSGTPQVSGPPQTRR